MELQMPDMYGAAMKGYEDGKQGRLQRLLQQNAQAAIGGDKGALAKLFEADPASAMKVQEYGQQQQTRGLEMDDKKRQRLGQHAAAILSAPAHMRPAMYKQILPELQEVVPGEYATDWNDAEMVPMAQQIAQAFAGEKSDLPNSVQEYQYAQKNPGYQEFLDGRRPLTPFAMPIPGGTQTTLFNGRTFKDLNGNPINQNGSAAQGGQPQAQQPGGMDATTAASMAQSMAKAGIDPDKIDAWLAQMSGSNEQMAQQQGVGQAQPQTDLPQNNVSPMAGRIGVKMDKPEKPQFQARQYNPQEVAQMGLPPGTVAYSSEDGTPKIVSKPPASSEAGQVIDNGDGTTTYIPAGKTSADERNAAGFYGRMTGADKELGKLEADGYDPTNVRDYMTVGSKVLNGLSSSQGQQYHQASQNWVRANLRKESGAAIGVAEMDQEIKNYFPQFGDKSDVIKQKAHNRQVVEQAMRLAAGKSMNPNQPGNAPNITTKAQFDALPSGAEYMEDGQRYRKP